VIIAIDGPAGSGKSTVAKLVAKRLGFAYLDTGAMYRSVAWRALQEPLDLSAPLPDASVERIVAIATDEPVEFGYEPGEALPSRVMIGGVDVTDQIRSAETDRVVSVVSAEPGVRAALTLQQREFGLSNDTVMEGRDIGSVVFPDAELKVYLTASAEERAQRRTIQAAASQRKSFDEDSYERVLADIRRRDDFDSSRQASPLVAAADSIELDTTSMSIDAVVSRIVELADARLSEALITAEMLVADGMTGLGQEAEPTAELGQEAEQELEAPTGA
jgi:cytidylate kinase